VARELRQLHPAAKDLASVYASYAVTIAGFLSAIAVFLFSLADKPYFAVYKARGNFSDLMFCYAMALLVAAALFIAAVGMHSHPSVTRAATVLAGLSLIQITLITLISFFLSKRSQDE
jgi:hypothetical protein